MTQRTTLAVASVVLLADSLGGQKLAPVPEFHDMPGYCRYLEGEIVLSFRAEWLTGEKLVMNPEKPEDLASNKEAIRNSEAWRLRHDTLIGRWQKVSCASILYPPKPAKPNP